MRLTVFICITRQLLYFITEVESLTGPKVIRAGDREFPFVASLQYHPEGQHFCSGALVTNRHVITAAHCLMDEHPEQVRVVLGIVDFQTAAAYYTVASWMTYNVWAIRRGLEGAMDFQDIAIVTLSNKVNQPNVRLIRLTDLNKQHVQGKKAIIIGWDDGADNEVLRKATVKVLSNEDCKRNVRLIKSVVTSSILGQLCTAATPYVLLRGGDSGGPLVDGFGALLGINIGEGPRANSSWGNFSEEFLQPYQVNKHMSIDYYRQFIIAVTAYC